ncbi:MAG: cysteine synthase family protein [Flavobacteriales bacterium]|nr:cysteine synthase family protein [Flavobacteriales bacterium]
MTAQNPHIAPTDEPLKEVMEQLSYYVGNTPLFPIRKLNKNPKVKVYAKLEWQQLGGSVKARPAFNIMKKAVDDDLLSRKVSLLDASSGNTGIAYAVFAAAAGIPITLCIPENASQERKNLLKALNVNVIYTSPFEGTDGAQKVALELYQQYPERYFYADQYNNSANWEAHFNSTAPEIWDQTEGTITHFIAGLGTTGTFVGTTKGLKALNPNIETIAVQPETALHGLEGWKHLETAKVPGIFDANLATNIAIAKTEEAYSTLKDAAKEEGLLLSPSSAANLRSALNLAEQLEEGVVVTVFPDDSSKYGEVLQQINL